MEYIYAALLLHKVGKEVTEDNVKKVIHATGAEVNEAKVKTLIASLKGVDIDKAMAESIAMPAASSAAPAAKAEVKEEKAEAAAEGLSALFG